MLPEQIEQLPEGVMLVDENEPTRPSSGHDLLRTAGEIENYFVTSASSDLAGHAKSIEHDALLMLMPGEKVTLPTPVKSATP